MKMLAFTSSGVEMVSLIMSRDLDQLGRWLCDDKEFHEFADRHKCADECDCMERFEREQKRNGGYCDHCRDFAGELLSVFNITVREAAQ